MLVCSAYTSSGCVISSAWGCTIRVSKNSFDTAKQPSQPRAERATKWRTLNKDIFLLAPTQAVLSLTTSAIRLKIYLGILIQLFHFSFNLSTVSHLRLTTQSGSLMSRLMMKIMMISYFFRNFVSGSPRFYMLW